MSTERSPTKPFVVVAGLRGERGLGKLFRAEDTVDCYDRERVNRS